MSCIPEVNHGLPGIHKYTKRALWTLLTNPAALTMGLQFLNTLPQGTDWTQRIGRMITCKSLEIRIFIYHDDIPASSTVDVMRITLVYDRQPVVGGTNVVNTDVYANASITSLYNANNKHRFIILREWIFPVGTVIGALSTPAIGTPSMAWLTDIVDLQDLPTVYNGTTSVINQITTGNLFLMYYSLTGNSILDLNVYFYFEDK